MGRASRLPCRWRKPGSGLRDGVLPINSLRGVAEIEIDLPHMDLQAVPMGGGHALGHLVAVLAVGLALRQEFAGIFGPAGPKLVGQDHVESTRLKGLRRSLPVARIGSRAGMVPKGPALMRRVNDLHCRGRLGKLRSPCPSCQAAEAKQTIYPDSPPHGDADAVHVFPSGRVSLVAERRFRETQRLRACPPQPGAAAIPAVAALEVQGDLAHGRHVVGLDFEREFPSPRQIEAHAAIDRHSVQARLGGERQGQFDSAAFPLGNGKLRGALRIPLGRRSLGVLVMKRVQHRRFFFSDGKRTGNQQKSEIHGKGPPFLQSQRC